MAPGSLTYRTLLLLLQSGRAREAGVDVHCPEKYLLPEELQRVLELQGGIESFQALPSWMQRSLRKKSRLYVPLAM